MNYETTLTAAKERSRSKIRVLVIAESHPQRTAFNDTVRHCGFTLVDSISPLQLQAKLATYQDIDIWLVDSTYDDKIAEATRISKPISVLIGFSQAPYINEPRQYAKWQRKLKRKLSQMLALPDLLERPVYEKSAHEWRYVVFLGASMGGPQAIKEFLDHLSPQLPISILLAHHFNQAMLGTLPRILNRHNEWHCQIITSSQRLQMGQCLIAPIDKQIVCDSTGRVILLDKVWVGEYKPNIGQILKNTSDVYGSELINIIFSGMGNDGTQFLDQIQDNKSQLWAQDPKLSVCPSQPKAIVDSGYCHFVGGPRALAEKLTDYVGAAQIAFSR